VITLERYGQIELTKGLPIFMEYLRYGEPTGNARLLEAGRYIVDKATEDEVILAPADWDKEGRVTFHSTKHTYRITGKKGVDELRAALYLMGPKEWRPEKR
jgi:hypothetical protein